LDLQAKKRKSKWRKTHMHISQKQKSQKKLKKMSFDHPSKANL